MQERREYTDKEPHRSVKDKENSARSEGTGPAWARLVHALGMLCHASKSWPSRRRDVRGIGGRAADQAPSSTPSDAWSANALEALEKRLSRRADSNCRPAVYETAALPAGLRRRGTPPGKFRGSKVARGIDRSGLSPSVCAAMVSTHSGNGDFIKLWTGFTIARVGSQITVLALPLTAVLLLGAGATETGLLVAAQMLPSIVAGLFIGVWVDRLPRRPIMIWSDIGSAVVIASVPLAAAVDALSLAQLYVVSFLGGAFAVSTDLARAAMVPSLVGRTRLVAANSRLQASNAVAQVAGPSLGGILVQTLTAPIAMLWDAVGFVVSALFIVTIRSPEPSRSRETERSVWHEVTDGLRWVRRQPIVFRCITAIALANIEWFAVQGVLVVYATRELGLSPALLGISLAAIGQLSLLGAAVAGPLTARWGLGPVMIAALFLETLSRLLLPFASGTPVQAATVLGLSQALLGLTVPLWVVSSVSLVQALTPEHLLGRVNSATRFVGFVVAPPAAFGAGIVGDLIGLRPTLFAAAVIAALAFLYLLLSPVRRYQHPTT